jgi:type I restriction enzyme R subunit
MPPTSNFNFLKAQDAQLAQLGALAERYFRDDPGTAVFKLRHFAELLSKTVAAHNALYLGERETFEETLRRLSYERIIPKEAADVFHALRKAGDRAAHETTGSHSDACHWRKQESEQPVNCCMTAITSRQVIYLAART